jgi:hypothetical protein
MGKDKGRAVLLLPRRSRNRLDDHRWLAELLQSIHVVGPGRSRYSETDLSCGRELARFVLRRPDRRRMRYPVGPGNRRQRLERGLPLRGEGIVRG